MRANISPRGVIDALYSFPTSPMWNMHPTHRHQARSPARVTKNPQRIRDSQALGVHAAQVHTCAVDQNKSNDESLVEDRAGIPQVIVKGPCKDVPTSLEPHESWRDKVSNAVLS